MSTMRDLGTCAGASGKSTRISSRLVGHLVAMAAASDMIVSLCQTHATKRRVGQSRGPSLRSGDKTVSASGGVELDEEVRQAAEGIGRLKAEAPVARRTVVHIGQPDFRGSG